MSSPFPTTAPALLQDFTLRPASAAAAAAAASTPSQQLGVASPLPQAAGLATVGAPSPPSLIRDDPSCRLWHKTDGQFRKPKLNVEILLSTPVLYESPESLVSGSGW